MATQKIIITMKIGELVYDIQDKTHLIARDKKDHKRIAHVQATDDSESLNLLKRSIGEGLNHVREAIGEFCGEAVMQYDDTLDEYRSGKTDILLSLPTNFNDGVTPALTTAIHQYVTDNAIADWLMETSPEDAARYKAEAATDIQRISHLVKMRKRPKRRCGCCHGGSGGGTVPTESYTWNDNLTWNDNSMWKEHA